MEDRSVRQFIIIQASAVIVVFFLMSGVGMAGYILYGAGVASDIMVALPHTPACLLAQALMIPVVISMYPLSLYPVSVMIKDFAPPISNSADFVQLPAEEDLSAKKPQQPYNRGARLQLVIVAFTGVIAATGIDLGPINNYCGIMGLGWFTVVMPAIVYYRLLELDGQRSV